MQDERRKNEKLVAYWDGLRNGRLFPCESDIDPDLIADVWDGCYLLQVRDIEQVEDYNFTYLGKNIVQAYADNLLDEESSMVISPNASNLSEHFVEAIEQKKPITQDGSFISARGNEIAYRQSILPIGFTDNKVEALFGGMFFMKK